MGSEKCDDGSKGGCLTDCSGAGPNWNCSQVSAALPTSCKCNNGLENKTNQCVSVCGNGYVTGSEVCDDKNKGCLSDCTGSRSGFKCSGGNDTSPSVCVTNSALNAIVQAGILNSTTKSSV